MMISDDFIIMLSKQPIESRIEGANVRRKCDFDGNFTSNQVDAGM